MRTKIKQFKDKIDGQDVFLIGGGPSLKGFDFSVLNGKNVVALNSAFLDFENPTAIFWMDSDWPAKYLDQLEVIDSFKFTSRSNAKIWVKQDRSGFAGSTMLNNLGEYGYSTNVDEVYGNNSGAQALNFLSNLNPNRIMLLGFDLGTARGACHYHERYEYSDPSVYGNLFIPSIEAVYKGMKHLPIKVINCNLNSKLQCFKKDKLERYL